MKTTFLPVIVAVLWCLGCGQSSGPQASGEVSSAEETTESLVILPEVGLGKLKFGMTGDQVEQALGKPSDHIRDTRHYKDHGIRVVGNMAPSTNAAAVIIFGGNDPVYVAKARKYKMRNEIGMDSTLEEIVQTYGKPTSVREDVGYQHVYYDKNGVTFTLVDNQVIQIMLAQPVGGRP